MALADADVVEEVLGEYQEVQVKAGASPEKRVDVKKKAAIVAHVTERKREEEKQALAGPAGGAGGGAARGGSRLTLTNGINWTSATTTGRTATRTSTR